MKKTTWGNKLIVIFTILLFSTFFLSGCSSYYKVKDPQSGSVWYTTEVDRSGNGRVEFKDAKTGWDVTVLSAEILEISEEEYKENTKKNKP